jgi:hypothetical protein
MSLKDITITGSIGTYPTLSYGQKEYVSSTDEQSFPIEQVTGSSGGATPNFYGQYATTDLYVNVTQSWDVYDNTPVGIVFSVHNTQDEFIDGEYSGSILEVTNQGLIDANCVQFLTVNTTELDYKAFFYYTVPFITFSSFDNEIPLSNFLDANTAPNDGEIYLSRYRTTATSYPGHPPITGIIYAKVARKDVQGNDNTLSLQELTDLRFKFSDVVNVVNYHVLTITEYPTYYLYSIQLNNTTSIDNNVLDHTFNASSFTTSSLRINAAPGFAIENITTIPYYSVNTDTLNYYSASTPFYVLGDTPNVKLAYTASTTIKFDGGGGDGIISLYYSRNNIPTVLNSQTYSTVPTSPITIAVSGTFLLIENDKLFINLGSSFLNTGFTASNIQWSITQSVNPNSLINLTVLEPYLLSTFTDSDCDVLMNNADSPEYDINFMKVDYDGNGGLVIPSNQQQILSNTAERAPVKPYNYRLLSQILPRYNGVRTTSLFPNKWTGPDSGFVVDGVSYPGDYNTFGKLPVVDLSNIFVAYCDVIEENTPEINGASYAHIKYLIDENGNIRIPNVSENSLPDVQDTFITNENISIYSSAQNAGEVTDLKSIIRGGQRVETVLYNQNGYVSPIAWENTIKLEDNNTISGLVNDYQALLGLTIDYNNPSSGFFEIPFDFIYSSASAANNIDISTPGYRLKVTSGMISDNVGITFKMNAQVYSSGGPGSAYFELHNFTTGTSYSLGGSNIGAYATANYPLNIYIGPDLLALNNEWGIRMTTGHTWEILKQSSPGINQLQIIQSPAPTTTITPALSIWQSASGFVGLGNNILFTTQSQLVNLYNSPTLFQQQIVGSGFNTSSLGWNLLPGDEFRFEGREDMVYMVERAFISGSLPSASLIINLDRPLASSSIGGTFNVNHFMIRRYINDPSSILFSGTKPFNSIAPYIIKPQYVTNLLNKNIDKYVIDLTGKGIITP